MTFNSLTHSPSPQHRLAFFSHPWRPCLRLQIFSLVLARLTYAKWCSMLSYLKNHLISCPENCEPLLLKNMIGTRHLYIIVDFRNFTTWNTIVDANAFASTHFQNSLHRPLGRCYDPLILVGVQLGRWTIAKIARYLELGPISLVDAQSLAKLLACLYHNRRLLVHCPTVIPCRSAFLIMDFTALRYAVYLYAIPLRCTMILERRHILDRLLSNIFLPGPVYFQIGSSDTPDFCCIDFVIRYLPNFILEIGI